MISTKHELTEGYLTIYIDGTYVMMPWNSAP